MILLLILGIDPGYAIVGYGVVEYRNGRYRSLEHGAIITEAGTDFNRRLEIIYDNITEIKNGLTQPCMGGYQLPAKNG